MTHLIDKSALVAKITHKIKVLEAFIKNFDGISDKVEKAKNKIEALGDVLLFIESLEVKEVDINKKISQFIDANFEKATIGHKLSLRRVAKHFFELGLEASNPITAADRGTAEEIIVNLKRVEQDYKINLTREMEWLRNKVKKGK